MNDNIFLAKAAKVYYLIRKKLVTFAHHSYSSFFIISIFVTAFPSIAFTDEKLKTAEEYRIKGFEEQQKGNFEKSFQYYVKSLSLMPDNAGILNDIGILYEQMGFEPKAEEYYLKAIRVDKEYLPPYMNLAYMYQKLGETEKAIRYFEKRIKLSRGDDPWAARAREELMKLDPQRQKQAIADSAQHLESELVQKAQAEFSLQIMRAEGHYQDGLKLYKKKDYAGAVEAFDQALTFTPDNPKIQRIRDKAVKARNKEEVRQRSKQALQMLEEGDPKSAEEEFRKILTILPKESDPESN